MQRRRGRQPKAHHTRQKKREDVLVKPNIREPKFLLALSSARSNFDSLMLAWPTQRLCFFGVFGGLLVPFLPFFSNCRVPVFLNARSSLELVERCVANLGQSVILRRAKELQYGKRCRHFCTNPFLVLLY